METVVYVRNAKNHQRRCAQGFDLSISEMRHVYADMPISNRREGGVDLVVQQTKCTSRGIGGQCGEQADALISSPDKVWIHLLTEFLGTASSWTLRTGV